MRKPATRPARPAPEPRPRRFTLAEEIAIMRVAVEGMRQAHAAHEADTAIERARKKARQKPGSR